MATIACEKIDALSNGVVVFSICRADGPYFNKRVPVDCQRCQPKVKREKKLPPLRKQIANLAVAVKDAILDPRMVTDEQHKARLETCDACEFKQGTRCTKCGCFLAVKSQFKTFTCPDNRWEKL